MITSPAQVNILISSVMRHMMGELSAKEAATTAGVSPGVVMNLSSEFAAYMLPRAVRASRQSPESSTNHAEANRSTHPS